MYSLRSGRLPRWLRYLLSGTQSKVSETEPKTLLQQRAAYVRKLELTAAVEETKNKELEAHLEFRKREHVVLERIQKARSRKEGLWELLGEYGVRKPRLLKWGIVVGAIILLSLLFQTC